MKRATTIQGALNQAFPGFAAEAEFQETGTVPPAGSWKLEESVCGQTCRRVIEKGAALFAEYRDHFGDDYPEIGAKIVEATRGICEVICNG